MAIRSRFALLGLVAAGVVGVQPAAFACGTCGCGLPGSNSEVASVASSVTLYESDQRFLIQTGVSFRDITGSFNELGDWTEKPSGSSLTTLQGNLGITYYPTDRWTLGVQLPMASSRLVGAQWGPQGSVSPAMFDDEDNPIPPRSGGGLGDIALQASYVALEGDEVWPSLALWSGALLPTGNASGDPSAFTGSGVWSYQLGLSALQRFGPLELSASAGFQGPFAQGSSQVTSAFYVGQSLLGQLQANLDVGSLRFGLGASAFRGRVIADNIAPSAESMGKLKLTPSVEWRFVPNQGIRVAYGSDPGAGPWLNAMTDRTWYASYFCFL